MSKDKKEYQLLPISDVKENSWNPNSMPKTDFEGLKNSIDKSWGNFKQPILVREVGWSYEIIDGAHRYRAMKELEFDDIVAVVLDLDDAQARVKTIAMNKLRGTSDPVKLSELISELKKKFGMTEEEIQGELSIEQKELEELSSLTDFDMSFMNVDIVEIPLEAELITMRFEFAKEEIDEIYKVAHMLNVDTKTLIMKAIREAKAFITTEVATGPVTDFDISDISLF